MRSPPPIANDDSFDDDILAFYFYLALNVTLYRPGRVFLVDVTFVQCWQHFECAGSSDAEIVTCFACLRVLALNCV